MKKVISGFLTLVLMFGLFSPSYSYANENTNTSESSIDNSSNSLEIEQTKMIQEVEPYVQLTKRGTIQLKNVPQELYEKYNLDLLQAHFEKLNNAVKNDEITINKDLSITDNSMSTLAAVYGSWTYHWWGYDRKFNNSQAKAFVDYCYTVAAGATIVTGVGAFFPPVAAIGGVQAGYWALVATRVNANNNGKGVYIGVTWVAVFNVEPL